MNLLTSFFAFSLRILNSERNGFVESFRLHLHSPQSSCPLLHFLALSSDSFSESKKYLRYQKTGQILKLAPNFLWRSTVGWPPVKVLEIFLSTTSSVSVVKIAVSGIEEDIAADHEPACSQLGQVCKGHIEVAFGAGMQDMELEPEGDGRRLQVSRQGFGKGTCWIY